MIFPGVRRRESESSSVCWEKKKTLCRHRYSGVQAAIIKALQGASLTFTSCRIWFSLSSLHMRKYKYIFIFTVCIHLWKKVIFMEPTWKTALLQPSTAAAAAPAAMNKPCGAILMKDSPPPLPPPPPPRDTVPPSATCLQFSWEIVADNRGASQTQNPVYLSGGARPQLPAPPIGVKKWA